MPAIVEGIEYFIGDIIVELGGSEAFAYAISEVIAVVAIESVLNAAQQALAPSPKTGVGPGLEAAT